jgi:hypothetical protein
VAEKDGAARLLPLEDPKGAQREAWDILMSAFDPSMATLPRVSYVQAMSNFATRTFRPQSTEECWEYAHSDEWLQQALLPPDRRQWSNRELFDSRLIGRDLDNHGAWRYRSIGRGERWYRNAVHQADLTPESTRQFWTIILLRVYGNGEERVYGHGEEMRKDQVAAIREDLDQFKDLVECYVEVAQKVSDQGIERDKPRWTQMY